MPPARSKGRFVKKSEGERREKVAAANKKRAEDAALGVTRLQAQLKALEQHVEDVGRRVVDIALLAKCMQCDACGAFLSFRYMEEENRCGLASVFRLRCPTCLQTKDVPTSQSVKDSSGAGHDLFSVNCKAALACLETGIGHEQLNNALIIMNVPPVPHTTMKRAERRVAPAILQTADDSCKAAIEREKALTVQAIENGLLDPRDFDGDLDDEETVIIVQYDFGWDRRGCGRSYNSHSGRGAIFGHFGKECLGVKVLSKICALCNAGHNPADHTCSKNYEGSSKGMEPHAAVELILKNPQLQEAKVRVGTLVADEDCSTVAALRSASSTAINKWVDRNHCVRRVKSKLYELKLDPNFRKILSSNVINYIMKCIVACLEENVGDVEGVKNGLPILVKHMFNEHDACGDWCKAKGDESYVFQRLPDGKPFTCQRWRAAFEKVIEDLCKKAKELAPGGMSLQNESFNQMCVSRAPKSRFYGSSTANELRAKAAVCKKNLGATHILDINHNAKLSPGGVTAKYRLKMKENQQRRFHFQRTLDFKKKRLFNKVKAASLQASTSRKEGFTYVTGMAPTMERAAAANEVTSWLPPSKTLDNNCQTVIVDIETTGFEAHADIIQIAAKTSTESFSAYMLPEIKIHPKASEKTGFTVSDGNLCYRGEPVPTRPACEVAADFIQFLQSVGSQVVLVGHNILKFDGPRLVKWLKTFDLVEALSDVVYGLTDTMPLLKQEKVQRQDALARMFLTDAAWQPIIDGAHNAVTDCLVLEGLLLHFNIDSTMLRSKSVLMKEFFERQAMLHRKKNNTAQLGPLLEGGVKMGMVGKMAAAGVTMDELVDAYLENGRRGVHVALGLQLNGKPRVTKTKRILDLIADCIEKFVKVK